MRDVHVTIEDYQKEWLEQEGINASKLLQDAIDDRMVEYNFDIEEWENTWG